MENVHAKKIVLKQANVHVIQVVNAIKLVSLSLSITFISLYDHFVIL